MAYLLPQLLERSAAREPEREAVVFQDQRLTYAELDAQSNRLARLLARRACGAATAWASICRSRCPRLWASTPS